MIPPLPPAAAAAAAVEVIAWQPPDRPVGVHLGRPAGKVPLELLPLPAAEPGLHLGALRAMVRKMPSEMVLQIGRDATPAAFLQLTGGDVRFPTEELATRLCLLTYCAATLAQFQEILDELEERLPADLAGPVLRGLVAAAGRAWRQDGGAKSDDELAFIDCRLVPAIDSVLPDPRQQAELLAILVRSLATHSRRRLPALYLSCIVQLPQSAALLAALAGSVQGRNLVCLPPANPNVGVMLETLVLRQEALATAGQRLPPRLAEGLLHLMDHWWRWVAPNGPDELTMRANRAALQSIPDEPQRAPVALISKCILPLISRAASSQLRADQLCQLLERTRLTSRAPPHYGQWTLLFSPELELIWHSLQPEHQAPAFQACLHYLDPPYRNALYLLAGRMGALDGAALQSAVEDWLALWQRLPGSASTRKSLLSSLLSTPPAGMPVQLRSRITAELAFRAASKPD